MSENYANFSEIPENLPQKNKTILTNSGISYAQIPRNLFKLTDYAGITYSDVMLALKMFDWCHEKRKFPKFTQSVSELVKITTLSRRQVMYGLDRLIDLRLIVARTSAGKTTEYQWNEYFLLTGELASASSAHPPVQSLHTSCAELAHLPVQTLHHTYIEFILDYIYILYKEYFKSEESLVKRIPPKRGIKGVAKDVATHLYVSRKDAWLEAIEASIKKGGYVRTYVALAGGFNIDQVNYPKSYLTKLIWDESHQYESKKKSHLANNGHLDDDQALLNFIQRRNLQ